MRRCLLHRYIRQYDNFKDKKRPKSCYRVVKAVESRLAKRSKELCGGIIVKAGEKCCFESFIWPESYICPLCGAVPYGPRSKCCHGKYIWPATSNCELCDRIPFPPTHKCCFNRYLWPITTTECPSCKGKPYSDVQTCCPDGTIIPVSQSCPSPALPRPPVVLCADPNWYPTHGQCDAHSRCIVDHNGEAGVETEGCGCDRFRNDFGICEQANFCAEDPCRDPYVSGWPYHKHEAVRSCRTYWKCDLNAKKTIPQTMCCQPYEYFNADNGLCELDLQNRCHQKCECTFPKPETCLKYADLHNSSAYYDVQKLAGEKWRIELKFCESDRIFSHYNCACIPKHNSGLFIPNQRNIPEPLVLTGPANAITNNVAQNNVDNGGATSNGHSGGSTSSAAETSTTTSASSASTSSNNDGDSSASSSVTTSPATTSSTSSD